MNTLLQNIFSILITELAVIFSLYGVGSILGKLRNKIRLHIERSLNPCEIKYKVKEDKIREEVELKILKKRKDALVQAILVESRSSGLGFLTKAVSLIELTLFAALTLFLLYNAGGGVRRSKSFRSIFRRLAGYKSFS